MCGNSTLRPFLFFTKLGAFSCTNYCSLNKKENRHKKATGWGIGFIIGFIDGNLGSQWHHEYIIKTDSDYKELMVLRVIEGYLKVNSITTIHINKIYEILIRENSNIENIPLNINQIELYDDSLELHQSHEKGKVLTIINNLILKHIKKIAQLDNRIELPISDFFSISEIRAFITDNDDYRLGNHLS